MNTKYSFRKSVIEKPQYWELTDQCILMKQEGGHDLQIPYSQVQSIRLRYLPNNRYRTNNYCCSIAFEQTALDIYSSSYEGIASFSNEAATYVPFVKELVQRAKAANPLCTVYTGQKPIVYYGNAVFTVVMVIALFLLFHYLPVSMGLGIFVKLLLIGYLGIFLIKSLRVNKPRQLTGSDVPANVLPEIS
jgi:pilus assembly protein TadC